MASFKSYLYDHPSLYDLVFPDRVSSKFLLNALEKYGKKPVRSVLDLGCGTGNTLEVIIKSIPECVGIDLLSEMIGHGKKVRPNLDLRVGDMRTVRVRQTFDGIGCFGWAFGYNLTDGDVKATLETFKVHAHPGTVLALNCGRLESYQEMKELPDIPFEADAGDFKAKALSRFQFDKAREVLIRNRKWTFPDGKTVDDFCEYRLHNTEGLKNTLAEYGFETREMTGDPQGRPVYPGEKDLYLIAVKQ